MSEYELSETMAMIIDMSMPRDFELSDGTRFIGLKSELECNEYFFKYDIDDPDLIDLADDAREIIKSRLLPNISCSFSSLKLDKYNEIIPYYLDGHILYDFIDTYAGQIDINLVPNIEELDSNIFLSYTDSNIIRNMNIKLIVGNAIANVIFYYPMATSLLHGG